MTPELASDINNFMVKKYRELINSITEGAKAIRINGGTDLAAKTIFVREIINGVNVISGIGDDTSNQISRFIKRICPKADVIANTANTIIKNRYNLTDTEKDFYRTYNSVTLNLPAVSLLCLGLPPRFGRIPSQYPYGSVAKVIRNPTFQRENVIRETENLDLIHGIVSLKDIYSPKFSGGSYETDTNVTNLIRAHMIYAKTADEYSKLLNQYRIEHNKLYTFISYLIVSASSHLFTETWTVYDFLGKGTVELYRRIMTALEKDISSEAPESHALYMEKYFSTVIRLVREYLDALSDALRSPYDLIDVRALFGTCLRSHALLFEHFRGVLETYSRKFQNRVSVYARINDIPGTVVSHSQKVFVSDLEMVRRKPGHGYERKVLKSETPEKGRGNIMWMLPKRCDINADPKPIRFTEVFGSDFPENGDVSRYMSLKSQIIDGGGVCLLTYGYSGTGKTFTLFGNGETNGILQSTLAEMDSLESVDFRLFEIYGLGLPYGFYWEGEIEHYVYHYNIGTSVTGLVIGSDPTIRINGPDFSGYSQNNKDTLKKYGLSESYTNITKSLTENIFERFSEFTDKVDAVRKSSSPPRICETPNNHLSSRSTLIYDFRFNTKNGSARFLIIDLPGREEINQTYIKPYFDNPALVSILSRNSNAITLESNVKTSENLERAKMTVTCMALNPIGLIILQHNVILGVVNGLPPQQKNKIYDRGGVDDIINSSVNNIPNKLSMFVKYDKGSLVRAGTKTGIGYEGNWQGEAVAAMFVMHRLLTTKRFDVIKDIYTKIVDTEINTKIKESIDSLSNSEVLTLARLAVRERFKNSSVSSELQKLISSNSVSDLRSALRLNMCYGYILNPLEGVYINENIVGLIKYMAVSLVVDTTTTESVVSPQKNTTLNEQRDVARVWLISKPVGSDVTLSDLEKYFGLGAKIGGKTRYELGQSGEGPKGNKYYGVFKQGAKEIDYDMLSKQRERLVAEYDPTKIFNHTEPLIGYVLRHYMGNIQNFIMLYLFGNYAGPEITKFKCEHQINLAQNTHSFTDMITSQGSDV